MPIRRQEDPLAGYSADWRSRLPGGQATQEEDPLEGYSSDWRAQLASSVEAEGPPAPIEIEGPPAPAFGLPAVNLPPPELEDMRLPPPTVPARAAGPGVAGPVGTGLGRTAGPGEPVTGGLTVAEEPRAGLASPAPEDTVEVAPPVTSGNRQAILNEIARLRDSITAAREMGSDEGFSPEFVARTEQAIRTAEEALAQEDAAPALPPPEVAPRRSMLNIASGVMPIEHTPPSTQLGRGFSIGVEGALAGVGETLETAGGLLDRPGMVARGEEMSRAARARQEALTPRIQKYEDIRSLRDFGDWAAYNLGQGLGSTMAPVIGGVVGGAVAGPAGAFAGAAGPSYTMLLGEVRNELEETGVDPGTIDVVAPLAAVPAAALESVLPGTIGAGLTRQIQARFGRDLARRLVARAAQGALIEGITEPSQEAITIGTAAAVSPERQFFDEETLSRLVNAALAGALPGAAFGGVGGITEGTLATDEDPLEGYAPGWQEELAGQPLPADPVNLARAVEDANARLRAEIPPEVVEGVPALPPPDEGPDYEVLDEPAAPATPAEEDEERQHTALVEFVREEQRKFRGGPAAGPERAAIERGSTVEPPAPAPSVEYVTEPITDRPAQPEPTTKAAPSIGAPASTPPELTREPIPATPAAQPTSDHPRSIKVAAGEELQSESGRRMAPFPRVDTSTDARGGNTLRRVDEWLLNEAKKESAGNEHLAGILGRLNPKKLSPSDRDTLNDVLFGSEMGAQERHRSKLPPTVAGLEVGPPEVQTHGGVDYEVRPLRPPRTPQVAPLEGMTPLGVPAAPPQQTTRAPSRKPFKNEEVVGSWAIPKKPRGVVRDPAALADYFTPGQTVTKYGGGRDVVVSFNPTAANALGGFEVQVRDASNLQAPVRTHGTLPERAEFERVMRERGAWPGTQPKPAPLEGRGERKSSVGIESISVSKREGAATAPTTTYEEEYADGSRVTRGADGSVISDSKATQPAEERSGFMNREPPTATQTPKVQTALGDFRPDASEQQIQDLQSAAKLVLDAPERAPRTPTQLDRWGEGILGTKDFTLDDVYDAFEGAANDKVVETIGPHGKPGAPDFRTRLETVRELEDRYFQGRANSGAMKELQQFSTPLPIAEAATYLAGVHPSDKVLEPSAGTGNLVNALRGTDATVHANELSPRRAAVLRTQGHEVTTEDALRLPLTGRRYNVVITNPPYGSIKKGQYSGFGAAPFGATDVAQRFFASSMESLVDGGRIVAVMPENTMKGQSAAFRKWLEENHTPVAYIQSPPDSYRSRGVRSGSVIMVVDKGKRAGAAAPLVLENPSWDQWMDAVSSVDAQSPHFRSGAMTQAVDVEPVTPTRETNAPPAETKATPSETITAAESTKPAVDPIQEAASQIADAVAKAIEQRLPVRQETTDVTRPSSRPAEAPGVAPGDRSAPARGERDRGDRGEDERARGPGARAATGERDPGLVAEEAPGDAGEAESASAQPVVPLVPRRRVEAREGDSEQRRREIAAANDSPVFAPYSVGTESQRAPHPRVVVETRSMAGMPSPSIDAEFQSDIVKSAWGRDGAKGGISDEQADQALRALTAWKRGHGFLDAADVGVGKTRIAGTLLFEAIAQGETRILYTTKNQTNVSDAIAEFRRMATGDPDGTLPFQLVELSQYKDVKAGTADLPTPKGPTVYIGHAYNLAAFGEALARVEPGVWLADEAHEYRNIATSNRGIVWAALHKSMLDRKVTKFAYFTATPAVTLDELAYLYGLREWGVGDFTRWVLKKMGKYGGEADTEEADGATEAAVQQVKTEAAAVGDTSGIVDAADDKAAAKGKKPFMRSKRDVFQSKVTPAETEQVMRELKGSGKYVSVDLWRGGVQFEVDEVDIMGDTPEAQAMRARYDQAAELVREISLTARKFGRMNKKVKGAGLERSMIQGYMKQLLFELRLPRVLDLADEALDQGKQVVISVHSVAGDAIQEEGVALEDTEIPPNKRLESAINAINVQHVEKQGTGMEAEFIDLGEIPEALMARAQLLERLRALPPLQDPIRRMEDHFGQNKVAAITGRVPAKQRTQLMGQFQSGQRKVAIISPAGKIGISLHDVNGAQRRMIVADYEWSADLFKQELGRVDRTGQKSSPELRLAASNGAGERKFAATIAARMASLGATSKGSAEATGTDALDQFDMSGDIARDAMRNAVERMDSHDRQYFTGSKFVSFRKLSDDTEELVPKRRPDEDADMRSFLLELLMFPLDASDRLLRLWEQERDILMTEEASERQAARRTTRMTGQVLRITPLSEQPQLTMYEVKDDEGQQLSVVQGFVTEFINDIQEVRGKDEKTGVSRTRRYVQFTEDGGELISGLELNTAETRRVKEFFGAHKRTVVTPQDAWNDLQLGEKIRVHGEEMGEQWILHHRKDGRIEIKGAKVSVHMDALKRLRGVVGFDPKGFFFVKPDQESLATFLERYKPVVEMAASPAEAKPDPRTDPRAGFAINPFTEVKSKADIPEAIASDLDEVEARWQAAKGIKDPTLRQRAAEGIKNVRDSFRRHYRHLNPASPTEALVADVLRQYEASPGWAKAQAYDAMSEVVKGLGKNELDLFTRLLVLPDIQKDVEAGLYDEKSELPFGYPSLDALEADLARFESEITPRVQEALDRRRKLSRTVTESLVREGLLKREVLEDDRYYHRQVMDYLNANQALGTSTGGDVRMRQKGFQKGRVGGTDFNTRYEQAEFEWLSQSYALLARKEALERVRAAADIKDHLKREAKGRNLRAIDAKFGDGEADELLRPFRQAIAISKAQLMSMASEGTLDGGDSFAEIVTDMADAPDDFVHEDWWPFLSWMASQPDHEGSMAARAIFKAIRDREAAIRGALGRDYINWQSADSLARLRAGYRTWQPEKGNHFFMGNTIEEQTLQRVLDGEEALTASMVRQMLVVGGPKETWIIPDGVARTLDNFNEFLDVLPDHAWRSLISSWKQWTLLNPARVLKYNLNNMSGDLDIVVAYDPQIAGKYMRRAITTLRQGKSSLISEARKKGVIDSGFSIAEVKDISDTGIFKALTNEDGNAFQKFVDSYWDTVRDATTFRENMLRLASYMYFKDQLAAGKRLYGASHQNEVNAVREESDRAAKLARELIGDYGNISHAGQWLRTHMFPFYCVPDDAEILTKRGWKRPMELQVAEDDTFDETVLTFNLETRKTEWQPLEGVSMFGTSGQHDIMTLSNKLGTKFRFTAEHRWPVFEQYGEKIKMVRSYELKSHHKFLVAADHEHGADSLLTPYEAAMLGWIVTDGYARWRGSSFEAVIYQSPKKHAEKIRRMFSDAISSESVHPDTGVICFRLRRDATRKLAEICPTKDQLPTVVTQLDHPSLEALYEAMMDAEGSVHPRAGAQFAQKDGPVMEAFQIVCTLLGKAFDIRDAGDCQRGYVRRRTKLSLHKWALGKEPYSGIVWCPKTPNGTWVMRQNGRVVITGNSWMEINAPRYIRLAKNASTDEVMARGGGGRLAGAGAKKVATSSAALALRAGMLYALVAGWNQVAQAMFDIDDDELEGLFDGGPQVILGRREDGDVRAIRFNGALGDFLSWLNLQDAPQDLRDLQEGDKDLLDMAGEATKAPVERLVNAMEPVTKTIFEVALGGSTYPTFFEEGSSFAIRPRTVRDPLEHIAASVSLAGLYRRVTGRPVRGDNFDAVASLLVYHHDPDEASYWSARGLAEDWIEEQGGSPGGGGRPTRRDNALYYYKTALRWGDSSAAERWRARYLEMGGTERGMDQSIRMSHPLGLVAQDKRSAFLGSLDAEDRALVDRAIQWHQGIYGAVTSPSSSSSSGSPFQPPRLPTPPRPPTFRVPRPR